MQAREKVSHSQYRKAEGQSSLQFSVLMKDRVGGCWPSFTQYSDLCPFSSVVRGTSTKNDRRSDALAIRFEFGEKLIRSDQVHGGISIVLSVDLS